MNISEQIKAKISELQESLLQQLPEMPTLLREIHEALKANPDVVTLLEPEEVGVIVNGLKKQTATDIATAALKQRKTAKSIGLEDL